jgi:hypothetical protein
MALSHWWIVRPAAIPPDHDRDPEQFRTARSVLGRHALAADVHQHVARRLLGERLTPVLDVGYSEGELARHPPHRRTNAHGHA